MLRKIKIDLRADDLEYPQGVTYRASARLMPPWGSLLAVFSVDSKYSQKPQKVNPECLREFLDKKTAE